MSIFLKNPMFPAVLLTSSICGAALFLVGMPGQAIGDSGPVESVSEPVFATVDEPLIQDLLERVERLEGELNRVQKSSQEPQMLAMLEGFRTEIEAFRGTHANAESEIEEMTPEAVAEEVSADPTTDFETTEPVVHDQVFSFEGPVVPEALVVIQGSEAGNPVFVEVMDRHGNWIEIFTETNPVGEAAAEIWIECPGAPMTEHVRVMVEGGLGVETVAVENTGTLYWSNYSD